MILYSRGRQPRNPGREQDKNRHNVNGVTFSSTFKLVEHEYGVAVRNHLVAHSNRFFDTFIWVLGVYTQVIRSRDIRVSTKEIVEREKADTKKQPEQECLLPLNE